MSAAGAAPVRVYCSEAGRRELEQLYSRTLEALPFPCQELDVRTSSFGQAHVTVCGPPQAPPLMLWQGTAAPAPFMLGGCEALAARYRIYVPDLPCEAGSRSEAVALDPGAHGYARWCVEVMSSLGLLREGAPPPPLHVGASLGGNVILDLATVAPETIRAAALVVPGGLHPDYGGWRQLLPLTLHFLLPAALYRLLPCRWTAWLALRGMMEEPPAEDPRVEQINLAMRHVRFFPQPPGKFSREQLRGCTAPMLVITAQHDIFGPGAATAVRAREVLPNCTAEVMPGARHIGSARRYEEVIQRCMQFFADRAAT